MSGKWWLCCSCTDHLTTLFWIWQWVGLEKGSRFKEATLFQLQIISTREVFRLISEWLRKNKNTIYIVCIISFILISVAFCRIFEQRVFDIKNKPSARVELWYFIFRSLLFRGGTLPILGSEGQPIGVIKFSTI